MKACDCMKDKKWLILLVIVGLVLLFVIGYVCVLATEKQSGSNELLYKVVENDLQRVYSYRESDSVVKPSISLFEGNRFQFTFSAVSSYLGVGTYAIYDDILVLNTDDGKYRYTFRIDGENIDRLIFDADDSSENIHLGDFEDGAVFR